MRGYPTSFQTLENHCVSFFFLIQICQLIHQSRNGMAECELFDLVPNLTWSLWAPLCHDLLDRHVLTYRAGTLIFAHEQVRGGQRWATGERVDSKGGRRVEYFNWFQT